MAASIAGHPASCSISQPSTTSENTDSVFSDASSRILGVEVLADKVNDALDPILYP